MNAGDFRPYSFASVLEFGRQKLDAVWPVVAIVTGLQGYKGYKAANSGEKKEGSFLMENKQKERCPSVNGSVQ